MIVHGAQTLKDLRADKPAFLLWKRRTCILLKISVRDVFHADKDAVCAFEPTERFDKTVLVL